jgi:hypothetical protein
VHGSPDDLAQTGTVFVRGDLQQHARVSLYLPATLVIDDHELPCTLHNMSAGGARIRTGTTLTRGALLTLRIDGHCLSGEVVWSEGEFTGIGFHQHPERLQRLIDEQLVGLPNRMERRAHRRCSVLMSGMLFVDGQPHACTVKNLSLGGARVACDLPLEKDRAVILEVKRFGMFPARTAWHCKAEYGLRFIMPPSQVAAMVGEALPRCIAEPPATP